MGAPTVVPILQHEFTTHTGCAARIEAAVHHVKTDVSSAARLIPHPAEPEPLKGLSVQECRDSTTIIAEIIGNLLNAATLSLPSQEIIGICYTYTHMRIKRHALHI
jgi:hypothetical protein